MIYMSSLSSFSSIQFKDDNFPLLSETTFNQQFIEKDGNFIDMVRLVLLPQVLAALELPSNSTTLNVTDTIQCKSVSTLQTTTLNNNSLNLQSLVGTNPVSVVIQADPTPPNITNIVVTDNVNYYNAIVQDTTIIGKILTGETLTMNPTSLTIDGSASLGQKTTLSATDITIDASLSGGPKNSISSGELRIQDYTATAVGLITADYIQFATPSYLSELFSNQLTITDSTAGSGAEIYSQLNAGSLKIQNSQGTGLDPVFTNITQDGVECNYGDGTKITTNVTGNSIVMKNENINVQCNLSTSEISIGNISGSQNYYAFNENTLQVNNITSPSYIRMNADTGLMIQNDVKGGNPENTNTFTHSDITIDNTLAGGPKNTLTSGDITIQDNTVTSVGQITADYLTFTIPSYQSQISASQVTINDIVNGYSSQISSGLGLFSDINCGQLEFVTDHTQDAEPFIRLQNINGLNNYIKYGGIYADEHVCFNLDNGNRFMKQNNPFSFKQYELSDGEYIEKYMSFVFVQGVSVLKLYKQTEYLDDSALSGWSCIISNYGGDILIDTFGLRYYSNWTNVGSDGSIPFKKNSTCRITLVYSSIDNEYLWAVSMF
jgi:hypothetical protein